MADRWVGKVVLGLAVMVLGACTGGEAGVRTLDTTPSVTQTVTAPADRSSPPSASTQGADVQVEVDAGAFADDAAVATLVDYLHARQASMRAHRITAQMVRTSTYQWLQQQRGEMVDAVHHGWTVPARGLIAVQGVQSDGPSAWIRLCAWGPSVDYIDESTGAPVREQPAQWYPFDVKMVFAGDTWRVAGAARGGFTCTQERP